MAKHINDELIIDHAQQTQSMLLNATALTDTLTFQVTVIPSTPCYESLLWAQRNVWCLFLGTKDSRRSICVTHKNKHHSVWNTERLPVSTHRLIDADASLSSVTWWTSASQESKSIVNYVTLFLWAITDIQDCLRKLEYCDKVLYFL